ncbi:MAG: hypothetical protein JSV24_07890 [Bacteroidales bacterium]|nr:MAG: hypothetical protein JSV24_07890 [Bacteroidales bacterium]
MIKFKTSPGYTRILILAAFFASAILCAGPADQAEVKKETAGEIVFPEIKGWKLVRDYPVYYPDNLWDYINGAADAYLSYLFIDLHIAEYVHEDGTIIKAEVYNHNAPEYAFGIYSMERSPEYHFQEFGIQGYAEPSLVHFITRNYYVKVTTNSSGEEIGEFVPLVARKVAECLGDPGPLPESLEFFPETGKVAHSEKFIADNFLGHDFMHRVFTTDYKAGDEEFILFLMHKDSPEECMKILESYYKFTGQNARIEEGTHTINDRYNGTIYMIWEKTNIWGVMNVKNPGTGKKFLDLMETIIYP